MVECFLDSGAYVYGITRSASDIKNLKKHKNLKIFRGMLEAQILLKKYLRIRLKKEELLMD